MSILSYYQARCRLGIAVSDPEQIRVLHDLDEIQSELVREQEKRGKFYSVLRKPRQVQGAYIWGGVGIGKTFMMDAFYQSLSIDKKLRIHFHAFMRLVHQRLTALQGKQNPLDIVADELSQHALVLCLDELLVTDITDAMMLAKLFKALSLRGVCLVATSNMKPDDLYLRGLQRDSFMPAIKLLKRVTTVIHVSSTSDYREKHLISSANEGISTASATEFKMEQAFSEIANGPIYHDDAIEIAGRKIRFKRRAENIIWMDFEEICRVPRNQHDYLDIASKYNTIFISNIRPILPEEKNTISLFVRMIDVFYDARVRFVYSSEKVLDEIYTAGHLIVDYARTRSRLIEMIKSSSDVTV